MSETQTGKLIPVIKTKGKTGGSIVTRKPLVIGIVDGHMHIQSGHVGTLPFALGAKVPFASREMSLDIPFEKLYKILKREYIDDGFSELYEKKYQPFIYDIAQKTDILANKVKDTAGNIDESKKQIQKLIVNGASDFCRLLQKISANYGIAVNESGKIIIDLVADNVNMLVKMLESGEAITRQSAVSITGLRDELKDVNQSLIKRADKITGILINLAVYIVDFYLSLTTDFLKSGSAIFLTLKNVLLHVTNTVIGLISDITQLQNVTLKAITREIVEIIMDIVSAVSGFIEREFTRVEKNTLVLQSCLSDLSKILDYLHHVGIGQFLLTQKMKTFKIAAEAVKGSDKSMILLGKNAGAEEQNIFAPIMVLPMDLDFACLDRFLPYAEKAKVYRYSNKRYWWDQRITVSDPSTNTIQTITQMTLLAPETPLSVIEEIRKKDVVNEEKGDFYYFHSRLSGIKPGKLFWVHPSEFKVYEYWDIQREHTILSVKLNPWRIVPLYHFEPRRYSGDCAEAFDHIMDQKSTSGSGSKERVFVGIKVYPNLGYKPLDPRLPSLDTMYKTCCEKDIPVMTHGSPNGAFTHDRSIYYEYDIHNKVKIEVPVKDLDKVKHIQKELLYFMQEYASPYAWELVLKKYKNLRLCIAHFGGSDDRPDSTKKTPKPLSGWNVPIDPEKGAWVETLWNQKIITMIQEYPNLYTDLSCHIAEKENLLNNLANAIIKWPDLRKRILFGTDWYMTELGDLNYPNFVEQLKEGIDYVDSLVRASGKLPEKDPSMWKWFSEINPFRFYRYDRIAKEYSKELVRVINDEKKYIKKETKHIFLKKAIAPEKLIYEIAKKLKKMGELPDAITS